jgi:hypothetical protein
MLAITFVVIQPTSHSHNFEFGSYYRALKITHPVSPDCDCCVPFYSQYRHYHKIYKLHPFLFASHGNGRFSICPSIRLLRSLSKRLLTSLPESLLFHSQRLLRSFLGVPRSIPIHKLYKHTNVWNTYYIPFLPKKVNNICSFSQSYRFTRSLASGRKAPCF